MSEPYVMTARAKGASEGRVLRKHVLKIALLPITTMLAVRDVVVGVHQDDEIDRHREARIRRLGGNGRKVGQPLALCPLSQVAHHVGLGVHAEDLALGHGAREPYGEIAGASPDVCDQGFRR